MFYLTGAFDCDILFAEEDDFFKMTLGFPSLPFKASFFMFVMSYKVFSLLFLPMFKIAVKNTRSILNVT